MWAKFCGFLLRTMGWKSIGGPVPGKKGIILGAPHTSAWDFVISYLFYTQFGGKPARVMVKKEFFIGPLSWILRKLGAVPVDRSNSTVLIKSLIEEMSKEDEFVLALAPEGTRKPIKKWKTGYHMIAKKANCPVYMGYFDWGKKEVSVGKEVELTDDAKADTARIQELYGKMNLVGKNPKNFVTR